MITFDSLFQAPFVVSITGHVDPLAPGDLKKTLKQQLILLQTKAEGLGVEHFLLLSALAKGADKIAASVAMELGWQIIAPLPLPIEEYRRDFEGNELVEFDRLIKRIQHFFVGYAPDGNPENTKDKSESGIARKRQYAFLGEFLTRHCEVLIACWDGKDAGGVGGTADVVELQLRGVPPHLFELRDDGALLDSPEGGRVIQILTARQKAPQDESKPFANCE